MRDILITDVVVIGGGIAGAGLAASLSVKYKTTLLERESRAGYHSTSRSAAVLLQNYGNESIRQLTAQSLSLFTKIAQMGDVADCGFLSPRGFMVIATKGQEQAFADSLSMAQNYQILTPDQAVHMIPILNLSKVTQVFYEQDAQDIDVDLLHQTYLKLARNQGAVVQVSQEVMGINHQQTHWQVTTKDHIYQAKVVVNAAGAWASVIANMAGASPIMILPKRRSMAVLPPLHDDGYHWPLFSSVCEEWYAKPQSGKLLVSPAEEDDCEPHDAYPDDMVLANGIDRFQNMISPEIKRIEHSWAGLRSFAKDRSPVLGFDGLQPGFFWLAGQGGYGVQTSPAMSQRAFDQIDHYLESKKIALDDLAYALSPIRAGL